LSEVLGARVGIVERGLLIGIAHDLFMANAKIGVAHLCGDSRDGMEEASG
jgi:hypothetical protein